MQLSVITSLFNKSNYLEIVKKIQEMELSASADKEKKDLDPKVSYYYALSLVKIAEYNEAIEEFTYVLKANIGISINYQCRMLRAYSFTKVHEYKNAEVEFQSLVDDGYESVMIFSALGHISSKLRKRTQAISYLEKALAIDPENINTLNTMSFVLAEYNMDLNLASKYIEKVLKQDPLNASYLDTYGFILIKQKKYSDAVDVLENAYRLHNHPVIEQHLKEAEKGASLGVNI